MPRMDGLTATRRIIELMPDPVQRCVACCCAPARWLTFSVHQTLHCLLDRQCDGGRSSEMPRRRRRVCPASLPRSRFNAHASHLAAVTSRNPSSSPSSSRRSTAPVRNEPPRTVPRPSLPLLPPAPASPSSSNSQPLDSVAAVERTRLARIGAQARKGLAAGRRVRVLSLRATTETGYPRFRVREGRSRMHRRP